MQALADLDVLIVDCQTTGASPAHGAVLELGWGVARASVPDIENLQAHWVTLPAGHVVDFQVRRLTGFDEADAGDALSPREAWERLRATMNGIAPVPAAIHFAKFELAFLRDWASRFEPETHFPLDAVCVHAIACRLYPDLPRRSLRALAGYLGHGVDHARRCLGHVEATAFIWRKLTGELGFTPGISWAIGSQRLAQPFRDRKNVATLFRAPGTGLSRTNPASTASSVRTAICSTSARRPAFASAWRVISPRVFRGRNERSRCSPRSTTSG